MITDKMGAGARMRSALLGGLPRFPACGCMAKDIDDYCVFYMEDPPERRREGGKGSRACQITKVSE